MGIPLLDHLTIGRNGGYFSFAYAGDISSQTAGYRGMVLREGKEGLKRVADAYAKRPVFDANYTPPYKLSWLLLLCTLRLMWYK